MARIVGITLPTVLPQPQWTSGITATCLWMKGRVARLWSCLSADSSTSFVHTFTGAEPSSLKDCMIGIYFFLWTRRQQPRHPMPGKL